MPTNTVSVGLLDRRGLLDNRDGTGAETATFRLPWSIWVITGGLAIWSSFSANPILSPVALVLLTVCIQLVWRRGEPPVLAFACAMQWLQASAVIFYTNSYGLSLEERSEEHTSELQSRF